MKKVLDLPILLIISIIVVVMFAVAVIPMLIQTLIQNSQPNYPQPTLVTSIPAFVSSLSIEWTSDGQKLALGQESGSVTIWNASGDNSASSLISLNNDTTSTTRIAWNKDGSILAAGHYDGIVEIWDTAKKRVIQTLKSNGQSIDDWIRNLSLNSNGDKAVVSNLEGTTVWNTKTGQPLFNFEDLNVLWSPDGNSLTTIGIHDGRIYIWDVSTGTIRSRIDTWASSPFRLSPDGKLFTIGYGIFDLASGLIISTCRDCGIVNTLAWNSDGTKLAIGGGEVMCFEGSVYCQRDYGIRIIDSSQAGELTPNLLGNHQESVIALAWYPDGTKLVSAGWDDTVRIWDASAGKLLSTFYVGRIGSVSKIALRPDGSMIAVIDDDQHEVHIWDLSLNQ
jgi:WD40 repeat protein